MSPTPRWLTRADKIATVVLLAISAAILIACGGGPVGVMPTAFAGYPRSPAFDEIIQTHVDAGTDTREDRLVLTTWFNSGDPRVAQFCSVRTDGRCSSYQYVHQTEFRSPTKTQLSTQTIGDITQLLATLPPSQKPAFANILVVSYRQNGVWQTRVYDRLDRPPAVSTLFEMTNAPIVP